ncbi:hypothetical protein P4518_05950 [Geobacillus thermodenitrificans]|jgi:hypothetical protein|uniref:hypothetical protein n=1 Tax=Geobacillus thermodenitrificans TaxID=33940 RepID=UPI002E237DEC|nr:hypothetical protein [Geobacillus thermodenitrificans]
MNDWAGMDMAVLNRRPALFFGCVPADACASVVIDNQRMEFEWEDIVKQGMV